MGILSFFQSRSRLPIRPPISPEVLQLKPSPYVTEYLTAMSRTEEFGFEAPTRLLVALFSIDVVAVSFNEPG